MVVIDFRVSLMGKKTSVSNTNLVFEELEPRLLLSADGLAVITESSVATLQNLVHSEDEHTMIVQHHAEQTSAAVHDNTKNNHRTELVILDSRAPNFQQLHNDIIKAQQQGREINVVILDAHRDGLEQISEALSKYDKLDAVHIVSHGSDGQLQLVATQLNNNTLKNRSSDISAWKEVFTDGGDLLIYGCNLADTQEGKSLVDSLSRLTATDVAASDDLTGNRLLGGDWDLEYTVGEVESQVAFSENMQQQWQGSLASPIANNDSYSVAEDQTLVINALTENATTTDLVAAWQLDEETGSTTVDATVNGNDGTLYNGTAWTASSRTGDAALSFDGNNDYVNLGSDASIENIFAGGGGTISAWINPSGWGENDYGRILDKSADVDAGNGWALEVTSSGDLRFEHGFETQRGGWEAQGAITLNTWQHVVVVYDNTDTANDPLMYINGVLQTVTQDSSGGTPSGTASSDAGQDLIMGNFVSSGADSTQRTFDGSIDEVGIYNRMLTPAEIDALFNTGIIANDTDVDGDALSAILVSGPSNGTLALNTDGSFTYTPNADFNGIDTFTYKVNDGSADSNTATATITVTPVNDAPVIDLDADDSTTATGLDFNTIFIDGDDPIYITDSDVSLIDVENDNLTSITVILTEQFDGDKKEILNATDPLSTGLTINWTEATSTLTISGTGTVADYLSVLSTVTYVNTQNNPDTRDRIITFVADDGTDASLVATTTVSVFLVSGGNNVPVATANTVGALEDNNFNFSSTDFTFIDVDGDPLISATITNQSLAGGTLTYNAGTPVINGVTLTAAQLDTLIYTPAADANGLPLATFDFAVNDADLGTVFVQMSINITSVNDAPTVTADGFTVDEGSTTTLDLAFNDNDIDDGLDLTSINIVSGPANGSIIDNNDGTVDYIHDGTETISDSFTYNIKDFSGVVSNTVVVNLTVNLINDSPVATNDPGDFNSIMTSLNPESYWRFGETSGTTAADDGSTGNSATYSGVTLGQSGAISGSADTSVSFDGSNDYIEIAHDNSYLLNDGTVQLWFNADDLVGDQALISKDHTGNGTGGHFTIRLLNDGSITIRLQSITDSYTLSTAAGSVAANSWHHVAVTFGTNGVELFLDGASADTNAYTGGLNGNNEPIVIGANTWTTAPGSITPLTEYFGGKIDEVAILGQALTAEQIQNLYSSAVQNYSIAEDATLVVAASEGVLINDTDEEGNPLTASLISSPLNGLLSLNADGSFTYTPNANFSGVDTFTYVANDGNSDSNVATVTITISGDNDAPVNTVPGAQTIIEDTQTAITGISVADADAGVAAITTQLSVTAGVLDVTLSGSASILAGANGTNTLTVTGNVTDINATLASLRLLPMTLGILVQVVLRVIPIMFKLILHRSMMHRQWPMLLPMLLLPKMQRRPSSISPVCLLMWISPPMPTA